MFSREDKVEAQHGMPGQTFGHLKAGRADAAVIGAGWSTLNTLAPALVSAAVFMIASRLLTPDDVGVVTIAAVFVGTLASLAPIGFGDALVQRANLQQDHLDTTFWLCFVSSLAIYAVVAISAVPLGDVLKNGKLPALLWVIGIKVIFDLLAVVPTALMARTMRFRSLAVRSLLGSAFAATACLSLLHLGFGLWALVASQVVGSIVGCVTCWASVSWRPRMSFSEAALRDLTRYGLFATGGNVISSISADQLMVGGLMGVTAVGLFGFAKRISLIVTDLSAGALSAVTYSLLVSLQQEKEKLREAVLLATYASSLISFPLFVGLALVSPDAIPLIFGSHWLAAVPILQVVCALGLLAAIGIIQASVIKSQGRADWWMWYQAIQQLLTVLVVLMFYGYGLKSVALAIVVKTWIVWPATLVMTSHLVKLPMLSYLRQFSTPILGCISMAVSLHLLRLGFRIEADLLRLTAEILLGAAVYALTLWSLARKRLLLLFAHLLAAKAGRNHQRNAL